jgi:hypothetical protein
VMKTEFFEQSEFLRKNFCLIKLGLNTKRVNKSISEET